MLSLPQSVPGAARLPGREDGVIDNTEPAVPDERPWRLHFSVFLNSPWPMTKEQPNLYPHPPLNPQESREPGALLAVSPELWFSFGKLDQAKPEKAGVP